MMKQSFRITVTKIIVVDLDTDKLDTEFWREFNETITDRGGPDNEYLAEHIAWNYVQGSDDFVEGVGPLKEMNIAVREVDSDVEVEDRP